MPYRQDSREMTCVHRAVVAKNTDVFKTLTDPNTYTTPNADDEAADTKLAVDTCKELLTAVCFNHRSCLHLAAGLGKRKMVLHVRDLVKRFNMPEVFSMKQKDGRTAAHSASNFGHVDVLEILYNAPHGGKELISMEDDDGWTPLHWAADTMAPRIEEAFGASEAKIARHRLGLKWKEVGEAPPSAGGKELDSPALAAKLAQAEANDQSAQLLQSLEAEDAAVMKVRFRFPLHPDSSHAVALTCRCLMTSPQLSFNSKQLKRKFCTRVLG